MVANHDANRSGSRIRPQCSASRSHTVCTTSSVDAAASRYDRATPGERDYLRAMADVATKEHPDDVLTADVAAALDKRPQSLSPARDSLLKKGLIYSSERGRIAFTVPHFGRYLREHA